MKKHIITYTPEHKQVMDRQICLALAWHEGNINPVCDILLKAFRRHYPEIEKLEMARKQISDSVKAIRKIDGDGETFGKYDVLANIKLTDSGETILTEQEALALEHLTELVARLIAGQVEICFDWFHIPHINHETHEELKRITASLHTLCWNMPLHASYGLRYSEESDMLWDIYQVLRHERYLNFDKEEQEQMRWTVMAGAPMRTAKAPLISIRTIEE